MAAHRAWMFTMPGRRLCTCELLYPALQTPVLRQGASEFWPLASEPCSSLALCVKTTPLASMNAVETASGECYAMPCAKWPLLRNNQTKFHPQQLPRAACQSMPARCQKFIPLLKRNSLCMSLQTERLQSLLQAWETVVCLNILPVDEDLVLGRQQQTW